MISAAPKSATESPSFGR